MTTSDEWVRERAARFWKYELQDCMIHSNPDDGNLTETVLATLATALQEAIERGEAVERERTLDAIINAFENGRRDVFARLENPDEAMVGAARHAWMNRDLSDPDSEPLRDTIRALALTLTGQEGENTDG